MDGEWQTIESAPTDGTPILLFEPFRCDDGSVDVAESQMVVGCSRSGDWVEALNLEYAVISPTHWMPLPAPPVPLTTRPA